MKKVVSCIPLGSIGTGKTALINKMIYNHFSSNVLPTVGCNTCFLTIGDKLGIKFEDTSGQERYRSIIPQYARKAEIVLFIFSLCQESSWDRIPDWISFFNENSDENATKILVGTMLDLKRDYNTNIYYQFAQEQNLTFIPTSSVTGEGVDLLKNEIIARAEEIPAKPTQVQALPVNHHIEVRKNHCC